MGPHYRFGPMGPPALPGLPMVSYATDRHERSQRWYQFEDGLKHEVDGHVDCVELWSSSRIIAGSTTEQLAQQLRLSAVLVFVCHSTCCTAARQRVIAAATYWLRLKVLTTRPIFPTLYHCSGDTPFPEGGSGPSSNAWFFGPTRIHVPRQSVQPFYTTHGCD